MKEIDELSTGIEKLKKNSDSQKRLIEQLQKDRAFLIERTRFLGQKLGEAYVIYEEAGKRILDFVDKETAPIKNQIAELKAETRKISAIEQELKIHTSYLSKIRSGDESLKNRLLEAEKVIKKLSELTSLSKSRIDGLREKEAKEDEALESRLTEIKGHFETQLKTAQDRLSLKISEASEEVLQDATDSVNVLAASHEELKRNLSQTSLFVRQLKVNTISLKKQLENAGFSRAEIEKRVSGHQASIKELDSAVSKIAKRLDSINLEDEKLEKRLAEIRKSADENISSNTGQLKAHFDLNQKRQTDLTEARMKAVYEDFAARIAKINERLASERKEMGNIESLINEKISNSQKGVYSIKNDLEKRLSLHHASIKEIDSAISKMARRLEGIGLEDEKLEKRLAELRKDADEKLSSKISDVNGVIDSRIAGLSQNLDGKISKINERLASERREIGDIESLIGRKIGESQKSVFLRESRLEKEIAGVRKLLQERDSGLTSRIEKSTGDFRKLLEGEHAYSQSVKSELEKSFLDFRKSAKEIIESGESGLKSRIDSHQKKHAELLDSRIKVISQEIDRKIAKLGERIEAQKSDMQNIESLINEKISNSQKGVYSIKNDLEKRLSLHHASIKEIDSSISKMARRLEGIGLEDEKLEKRLAELRKDADEKLSSKISDVNGVIESRIAGLSQNLDGKVDRLKSHIELTDQKQVQLIETRLKAIAELDKKISEIRKSADESISSKAGQLKAHFDLNQKRQTDLTEARMKAVYEDFAARIAKINERLAGERKEIGDVESLISRKIAESQKTIALRESRLEKEIAGVRKQAAEAIDYKVGQLKSHIQLSGQKQVQLIETRLKAIAELDKKISEIRKSADESISSKAGQLKAHADLSQKRHAELLEARLKAVYEEFAGRISKINERLAGERRDIVEIESLINEKIRDSQESFDAKLSESYNHIENRISQVSSHVTSEKKAVAEMKIALERGIREEQKALSSKITGLSEKSWQRISGLSGDVSAEKKNLAEQRAKFSENIRNTVQAIAKLNEFTKSLDSRIKKHEDSASEKIEKNEEEVSDALKRIDSLATGLEKSGSFSKDLNVKLGRMESQIYSERKALLEKVKSMESSLRTSSLVTSALNKQLNALSSSKVSADKRISGAETRMKQLQAIDSAIGSKVEKHHIDFQNLIKEQAKNAEFRTEIEKRVSSQQEYVKGMESALTRVVKMIENVNVEDKRLEKRLSEDKEEMMRKLLEEQQSDKAEISKLREEIGDLKKDIKEWQEEQIKLYELLKEED